VGAGLGMLGAVGLGALAGGRPYEASDGVAMVAGAGAGIAALLAIKNPSLIRHVLARAPPPRPAFQYPSFKAAAFTTVAGVVGGELVNSFRVGARDAREQQQQQQQQEQQQQAGFDEFPPSSGEWLPENDEKYRRRVSA